MSRILIEKIDKTVISDDLSKVTHGGVSQTSLVFGTGYIYDCTTPFVITSIFSGSYVGAIYIGHEVPVSPPAFPTPTIP